MAPPRRRARPAAALASTVCAVLAAGCTATPPTPTPPVLEQVVARPVDAVEDCLRGRLGPPAGIVAGIAPTVIVAHTPDGTRIEQWFISPLTHQRTLFTLAAQDPGRTHVTAQLLQSHGQYLAAGFGRAAAAAVAACAGPALPRTP